jgi:hypothetical protein
MTKNQRKYQVGKFRQLIDLNGDYVNFELNFHVKSAGDKPFYALIVDQDILDADPDIKYRNSQNGVISGSILADKNVHQNYSLLLKADEDCECIVTTDIKELHLLPPPEDPALSSNNPSMFTAMQPPIAPPFYFGGGGRGGPPPAPLMQPPPPPIQNDRRIQTYQNRRNEHPPRPQSRLLKSQPSLPTWMILAIFCGIASLIAGYFAYKHFMKKSPERAGSGAGGEKNTNMIQDGATLEETLTGGGGGGAAAKMSFNKYRDNLVTSRRLGTKGGVDGPDSPNSVVSTSSESSASSSLSSISDGGSIEGENVPYNIPHEISESVGGGAGGGGSSSSFDFMKAASKLKKDDDW